jgi:hypothetical protein
MLMCKLLVVLVLIVALPGMIFAWSDLGGGVCECENCTDCYDALNNGGTCTSEVRLVRLNTSISINGSTCIDDPRNIDGKIFDCQGNTVDGDDTPATYLLRLFYED